MKRTQKRGFTIVELVIVIAVIAILAAVLIPTFSGLIKKANLSSDKQAVREMNMALAADEALNGKPKDIETVMKVLANAGYNSDNWKCLTSGYEVYWYQEDNRLVLYNASTAEVEYPDEYDAKIMTKAENHFFLYNENNQKAIDMDFALGSSSDSGNKYTTISSGKGASLDTVLSSGTGSGDSKTELSNSQKTALTDISNLLGNGSSANSSLKSSLGISDNTYVYGAREIIMGSASSNAYASMQVLAVGASEQPALKSNGEVKENLFYIGVTEKAGATNAEKEAAAKNAGELVYTVFTKINAGQITGTANVVLAGGTTFNVSSHEWAPVKEFTGYFGTSDQDGVVIDGAKLTAATGYASTVGFAGSYSRYFVTGFFGTVYGKTTIENVVFRNITFTEPAMDYALTEADTKNGKVNSRNCIGVIGGITEKAQGKLLPADVVLRNIKVEDSVNFVAGATAGGLVGYIGSAYNASAEDYLQGKVVIEDCVVSAKLTSNYTTAANTAYGPMGGVIGLICRNNASVLVKNTTFNGSVDGHYTIGALVGDCQSSTSCLKVEGTIDLSGAKLNEEKWANAKRVGYFCGVVGGKVDKDSSKLNVEITIDANAEVKLANEAAYTSGRDNAAKLFKLDGTEIK